MFDVRILPQNSKFRMSITSPGEKERVESHEREVLAEKDAQKRGVAASEHKDLSNLVREYLVE
jgi:hypothetical protein